LREIGEVEERIETVERQLQSVAAQNVVVKQLQTIPGIGLLTATALLASVGDSQRFPSARHFASYLGLTPREHSTGERRRLGAISKRGDTYLRMLLIHGARRCCGTRGTRRRPTASVPAARSRQSDDARRRTPPAPGLMAGTS
jgi:transposase